MGRPNSPTMVKFLIRRIVALVALLIAVSIVTFALFTLAPSDPAEDSCGKSCTPERIAQIKIALGLDKPIVTQYLEYMKGLVNPAGREMGPPGWALPLCLALLRSLLPGQPVRLGRHQVGAAVHDLAGYRSMRSSGC